MAHEDADVVKIRNFVVKSLESVGTLIEFPEYNYAEVLIPDEFVGHFDGKSYFELAFDFDVSRQHKDSEFVTYGSYFLDKVIELASQRGLACKRHILGENVEIRNLPPKITSKIAFRNCRATFQANVPVIYHYVLFDFKVSYISDEREDRIIRLLVNLNTGHIDNRMLGAIESVIFTDSPHTNYTVERMCSIDDAYRVATNALEEQIQPAIHEINKKTEARLANEKKRIMEYYDQIDNELNLKREKLVAGGKEEGVSVIDDKLRLSKIERQRRLNEIDEKSALKVSIILFNATLISQTKIRNRFMVKRGRAERDVYAVWNPALNDVDPQVCEICGVETLEVELCSNSHLGCTKCVRACSVCGVRLCRTCGLVECSVCGDTLCSQCKIVCENCGDVLCKNHVEFCTCKEEKRREEREAEERKKEKRILELQRLSLQLSKSMKQYMDGYVRKNSGALNRSWKNAMAKANAAMEEKDKVTARAILRELDEKYPANAWVKANMVLSYERVTKDIASLGRQVVHLAPRAALAHTALGYIYQKIGLVRVREAIDEYEKAIEFAGDDEKNLIANAHYQIGKILYDQGNWWESKDRLELALTIDPGFEPARQALKVPKTSRRRRARQRQY